ncbi:MAG TPA: hypothetical protein VKG79_17890 [Bryobacteraceae bacterium]|nr:hypothetical protein [Bryobacteraceae bacterium]
MNTETIATLKTVCTAGRASAGYNGDCNDQLEQLVENGLLDAAGEATSFGPQRCYTPTEKGRELVRQLAKGSAA